MKTRPLMLPLLAAAVFFGIIASCAQMKGIPELPAAHKQALEVGQHTDCTQCHEGPEVCSLKDFSCFSHSPNYIKNHRFYASSDDRLCSTCHKSSFCNDCHTNKVEIKPSIKYGNRPDREMQHRGNFMTTHKIEGKLDPASCYRCHGRTNNDLCIACHR